MLEKLLEEYFELFSVRLSGHCCKVNKEISNFLKLLSKKEDLESLGEWFCWYFVAFQFSYYSSLKTRMDGRYPANWIFGQKSLQRWYDKNPENWLYFVQKFLNEANIQRPIDFCKNNLEKRYEEERQRFFNTDFGLFHCLQFAKFNSKSPSCTVCKNKKDCCKLWK